MTEPRRNARMRVDGDQAELLWSILYAERGRLIEEKITLRDEEGLDTSKIRHDLALIRQMMEEVDRVKEEL